MDFEKLLSNIEQGNFEDNPLTPHQNSIKNQILDAISRGVKRIVVKGSAGVGKTFMVKYLIEEYKKTQRFGMVGITAPTNRAVSVLMEKQPSPPYYMVFSTIHKALFLKRKINEKTGEVSFAPDYNPSKERPFKGYSLNIVDESSMLNSELLYHLENPAYSDVIMIFLGDFRQLPPVGEKTSPIFSRKEQSGKVIDVVVGGNTVKHLVPHYEEFELTEIIRQGKGNPIIDLSYDLPRVGLLEDNINEKGEGYSYTADLQFCIDLVKENEGNVRYLSWTNEDVNKVNKKIREQIYTTPGKVELGESIVFAEPYQGSKDVYINSQELKIDELDIKTTKFRPVFKFTYQDEGTHEITIEEELTYYLINKDVKIIHEDSYYKFLEIGKHLRFLTQKGLTWKAYYGFTEQFARFGYRYAMTVHKSQGGTFDTVIINMKTLNLNRTQSEKNSLWYTALTRASKRVFIYTPPFNQV